MSKAVTHPGAFARLIKNPKAIVALSVLGFIVFMAVAGPWIFPYMPETTSAMKLSPPTSANWFGTDMNGRDVFSRVLQGAQISLIVGLCGAMVSFVIGTAYGLVSGYVGGRTDNYMMRFVEVLQSVPRLVIIIVAIFTFGGRLDEFLNSNSAFALFDNNPRLIFTGIVAGFFTIFFFVEKLPTVWRRVATLVPLLVVGCGMVPETLVEIGRAVPVWRFAFAIGFVICFTGLFVKAERFEDFARRAIYLVTAIFAGLVISPSVEMDLRDTPLKPLVGYSKILLIILSLGLIEWLSMARIVRGQVLALKEQQFVLAARALGQSHVRILLRHLLPNLIGVVVVYLTLTIPAVILDESFLSFLGLGISDPQASWGSLLSDGKNAINPVRSYWWLLVFPAAAMSLTLLSLNFLGDALRDALDPRARR